MRESLCHLGCGHRSGVSRRAAAATLFCAGLGGLFSAPRNASAGATRAAPQPKDEIFMRMAIAEAAQGDFPFGAVIVLDGKVAQRGRNLGETNHDPTAHAEMMAIRSFVASNPAADLRRATLYASGEPCPMCMGAILWCGFPRLVFAASIKELSTKIGQIMLTSREVAEAAPFASIAITGGVLSADALALFP